MTEPNYRQERIERLLRELEYEVTRGILEREIDETLGFTFIVGISQRIPDGVVRCEFRTRPVHRYEVPLSHFEPSKLRVVK